MGSGVSVPDAPDAVVQQYISRLRAVESKVGTCLETIDELKAENAELKSQVGML